MPRSIYQQEAKDSRAFEEGASHDADKENTRLAERIQNNSHFVETGTDSDGNPIRIRYSVLDASTCTTRVTKERPRVVMIMGLAASLDAWKPQILDMLMPKPGATCAPMAMCLLDNRGIGESSTPAKKNDYSTAVMAQDVAFVLDTIGWRSAHLVGFSMGGMIAAKFAAHWPERVDSLNIISSSRGNWDSLPRSWRALKYVFMMSRDKTPRTSARIMLKFHFSKKTLKSMVPGSGRCQDGLLREYMQSQGGSHDLESPTASGRGTGGLSRSNSSASFISKKHQGDAEAGLKGQMRAVWTHKLSALEKATLRDAPFPRLCMHGRQDIVAAPSRGELMAKEISATMVVLEGAHFLPRERGHEVSLLLEGVILGQPRQLERQHLDPMRHMMPDLGVPEAPAVFQAAALSGGALPEVTRAPPVVPTPPGRPAGDMQLHTFSAEQT